MSARKASRGIALLTAMLVISTACGYRIRGSVGQLPAGIQSLGIPTFRNFTDQYKIEQLISSAVLREFSIRTRIPVNSNSSGVDAVLLGEIHSVSSVPATFGSQTFGTAFLVTVTMTARLVKLKDSTVIWQKGDFLFRERYVLNSDVRDFFSEENPALERLARDFASSLASTILENQKP
jgi:hypothetical protein